MPDNYGSYYNPEESDDLEDGSLYGATDKPGELKVPQVDQGRSKRIQTAEDRAVDSRKAASDYAREQTDKLSNMKTNKWRAAAGIALGGLSGYAHNSGSVYDPYASEKVAHDVATIDRAVMRPDYYKAKDDFKEKMPIYDRDAAAAQSELDDVRKSTVADAAISASNATAMRQGTAAERIRRQIAKDAGPDDKVPAEPKQLVAYIRTHKDKYPNADELIQQITTDERGFQPDPKGPPRIHKEYEGKNGIMHVLHENDDGTFSDQGIPGAEYRPPEPRDTSVSDLRREQGESRKRVDTALGEARRLVDKGEFRNIKDALGSPKFSSLSGDDYGAAVIQADRLRNDDVGSAYTAKKSAAAKDATLVEAQYGDEGRPKLPPPPMPTPPGPPAGALISIPREVRDQIPNDGSWVGVRNKRTNAVTQYRKVNGKLESR